MNDDHAAVINSINRAAETAGADVFAHAVDIDGDGEIGVGCDESVVTGSVFKVPILMEYVRQVADGELDPESRVNVSAGSGPPGSTGLGAFTDDSDWSLRDVATSMVAVSDNTATDIVLAMVGIDKVNDTMTALGAAETVVVQNCAAIFASLAADYGVDDPVEAERLMISAPDRVPRLSACAPEHTNRTTPRNSTSLLRLLWTDRAAPPDACAEARRIMGLQIWPHRLASGFPGNGIRISGKTGTVGVARNEIGVVEFPDRRRYAVAVFLRTHEFKVRDPAADRLIGTVAQLMVNYLAEA